MAKLSVVVPSNEVEVNGQKYRKVERKAQAGDIVKALTDLNIDVDKGAFYSVINEGGETGFYDNDGDFRHVALNLRPERFEVYEKVAPEYREVKRKAKVGERIKITNAGLTLGHYVNGDEFEIIRVDRDGDVRFIGRKGKEFLAHTYEYVVLEPVNYGDPAPEPERLKVGEYAKVVQSRHERYGQIVKVTKNDRVSPSGFIYATETLEGESADVHAIDQLVRATESEVEAAKKAAERAKNIGEFADGGYAEIVNANRENSTTTPQRNNGTYVKVTSARTGADHPLKVKLPNGEYGICNADALRKVTREEYEEATKPKPAFNVGDYAKVIRDNHEHRVGHIVQITEVSSRLFDYAVKRITYGGNGYIDAKNIEKISAEEVARIEGEAKWAAIGRKVNEYKAGDVVEVVQCTGSLSVGEIGTVGEFDRGDGSFRVNTERCTSGNWHWVEDVKLIVPVEQRFDLAEGGADLSK